MRSSTLAAAPAAVVCTLALGSCSTIGPPVTVPSGVQSAGSQTVGSQTVGSQTGSSAGPRPGGSTASPGLASEVPEPATTNTLPAPPPPTSPAPSTAGGLTARSLPVPSGWRTIARHGGEEEGYVGNGTWVHARDPRYASFDAITVGCAPVTRDDYTDPTDALEGTYDRAGEPGIGLALRFRTVADAARYFSLYRDQVAACQGAGHPVQIERLPSSSGLVDRRTYDDGEWTEVARQSGARVTLIILTDPGHRISADQAEALLAAMR